MLLSSDGLACHVFFFRESSISACRFRLATRGPRRTEPPPGAAGPSGGVDHASGHQGTTSCHPHSVEGAATSERIYKRAGPSKSARRRSVSICSMAIQVLGFTSPSYRAESDSRSYDCPNLVKIR